MKVVLRTFCVLCTLITFVSWFLRMPAMQCKHHQEKVAVARGL